MSKPVSVKTTDASLAGDLLYAARHYLGGRRTILIIAAIAILAGLTLSWNWLVAAGVAPILLTALPCLVMCGLGLCMNRLLGAACASQPPPPPYTSGRPILPPSGDGSNADVSNKRGSDM